jgi:5'-nucleotidase
MTARKPKLLLANDDGIDAAGIKALYQAIRSTYDVLVVAPKHEKSGAGCSLSLGGEMEVIPHKEDGVIWGYAVDGTPADCVKFALQAIPGYRPDLVLSGINRGSNMGNSVFYSGTVAAAIEATLYGLPAMACSLSFEKPDGKHHYADAARVVKSLIPWLLSFQQEPRTFWNINFPDRSFDKMGPIRITTQGTSFYTDDFTLYREEGDSQFFVNAGWELKGCTMKPDSDDKAVFAGEIALSLLRTDLTVPIPRAAAISLESHLGSLVRHHAATDHGRG